MATRSRLAAVLSGIVQNVDLTADELVVSSLRTGGLAGNVLTDAILGRLISLQNGTDLGTGYHTHDGRYFTETELGGVGVGTAGSTLIGDNNSYSNFTPGTATVKGALAAIDGVLGTVSGATPLDSIFRILNASAPTKKIAFTAANIVAGNTRTISMPDFDVDLGGLTNNNIAALAGIARDKLAAGTPYRIVVNAVTTGLMTEAAAITGSRALVSDANGVPTHSSVTSATLAFLDATSSVQNQLDAKLALAGGTMTGTLAMGANKITSSYVPLNGDDLVNKTALDNAITGIAWIHPVEAFNLRGNKSIAGLNALSPVAGDQYTATDAGTPTAGTSDALAAGDIAEFNGTSWKKIVANSGGFVPAGIRAILGGSGAAIASPYTDSTDNDKLVIFSGASNTGAIQAGVVVDQISVNVSDPAHISFYDNASFVYEGSAPSGSWIQFNGAGQITAGIGLLKTGNTLDVNLGAGIMQLPSDEVGIDVYGTAPGLILTTDGTTPSTATGAKLRAYDIADVNIAAAAAIAMSKLAALTAGKVLQSNASTGFIEASSISNATLAFLDATSSIQTQLNGKEPTITTLSVAKGGTNSSTALNNGRIMSTVGGAIVEAAAITAARALISDANGIPVHSTVTSATLAFLDATSSVQTQLNGKEPTITTLPVSKGGTNSSTALNNGRVMSSVGGAVVEAAAITAARALISDANGIPVHSTVTSATLAFLDATSSVQTQLNAKLNLAGGTMTGNLILNADPSVALGAATKQYVDAVAGSSVAPIMVAGESMASQTTFAVRMAVNVVAVKASVLTQGITFTAKTAGTAGNAYSVTVIDTGGAGLSYSEPAGAIEINLGAATPTTAQVVTLLAGSAFVDVVETTPGSVIVASIVSLTGGIDSETAGRVYKATSANALSAPKYLGIGLVMSTSAISAGDNVSVLMSGTTTLGSSDTPFNAADIGKSVYLTTAGGWSITAPSTAGTACFQMGIVKTVSSILTADRQLHGVN